VEGTRGAAQPDRPATRPALRPDTRAPRRHPDPHPARAPASQQRCLTSSASTTSARARRCAASTAQPAARSGAGPNQNATDTHAHIACRT